MSKLPEINLENNILLYASIVNEIYDACEHLNKLINDLENSEALEADFFNVDLAHIYAHLNRACNMRSLTNCGENCVDEISEKWEKLSQFPKDVRPIG